MRAVVLTATATLLAFAAGLAGTYFLLPMAVPGLVETPTADDAAPEELPFAQAVLAGDSLALATLFGEDGRPPLPGDSAALLLDSLAVLHARLRESEDRITRLLEQIQDLERQIAGAQAQRTRVAEVAATLTRLEERELGRLLSQLDHEVLATLYAEASPRDRARILAALAPARAAVLVRRATGLPPAAPGPLDDDAAYPPAPAY